LRCAATDRETNVLHNCVESSNAKWIVDDGDRVAAIVLPSWWGQRSLGIVPRCHGNQVVLKIAQSVPERIACGEVPPIRRRLNGDPFCQGAMRAGSGREEIRVPVALSDLVPRELGHIPPGITKRDDVEARRQCLHSVPYPRHDFLRAREVLPWTSALCVVEWL
jgi:hypothetical protein